MRKHAFVGQNTQQTCSESGCSLLTWPNDGEKKFQPVPGRAKAGDQKAPLCTAISAILHRFELKFKFQHCPFCTVGSYPSQQIA